MSLKLTIRCDLEQTAQAVVKVEGGISRDAVVEIINEQTVPLTAQLTEEVTRAITREDGLAANISDQDIKITTLQDRVQNVEARGRYLSLWDCKTGLPKDDPVEMPYNYHAGDYYIISTIASESDTNYRPVGSIYSHEPSREVELHEVNIDDVYYYDGNVWGLQTNKQKVISFNNISGEPSDNEKLNNVLNSKVDTTNDQDINGRKSFSNLNLAGNLTIDANKGIAGQALMSGGEDGQPYWGNVKNNDIEFEDLPKEGNNYYIILAKFSSWKLGETHYYKLPDTEKEYKMVYIQYDRSTEVSTSTMRTYIYIYPQNYLIISKTANDRFLVQYNDRIGDIAVGSTGWKGFGSRISAVAECNYGLNKTIWAPTSYGSTDKVLTGASSIAQAPTWSAIKTINGVSLLGSGDIQTEVQNIVNAMFDNGDTKGF